MLRRQAILLLQKCLRTDLAIALLHAYPEHRRRAVFRQHLRHRRTQPVMDTVVFTGDDAPGFGRIAGNDIAVDRLEGEHIDHRRANPLPRQHLRRLQRFGHHNAVGDQRDVLAVAQQVALTDGELRAILINTRRLLARGAHQ